MLRWTLCFGKRTFSTRCKARFLHRIVSGKNGRNRRHGALDGKPLRIFRVSERNRCFASVASPIEGGCIFHAESEICNYKYITAQGRKGKECLRTQIIDGRGEDDAVKHAVWEILYLRPSCVSIIFLPHTPAESKFFLSLVFTKMLLSAKGVRKNRILTTGGNKECRKSQA